MHQDRGVCASVPHDLLNLKGILGLLGIDQ